MTEEQHRIERVLLDAGWVALPGDLRDSVIRTAVAAGRDSPPASWADRVWYSVGWRVAAATILLGLVLLNSFPADSDTRVGDRFSRTAYEAAEGTYEVARHTGLPEADCRQLSVGVLVGVSRPVHDELRVSKE